MDLGIGGRTAVVTGADSGIGLATARMLAAEGARVVLTDKTTDGLQSAADSLRGVGEVVAVTADLSQATGAHELKRRGEADEVAAAIAFLCSAQASFITGSNLRVDGGSVASL